MKTSLLLIIPVTALILSSCKTRHEVEQVDADTMLTPTQHKLIYGRDELHESAAGTFSDRPQIAPEQAERLLGDSMSMQ